jgi:hypothetical protein
MKPLFLGYSSVQIFFGLVLFVLGIVGIALPASFLGTEYAVASAYVQALKDIGEDTGSFPSGVTGCIAGGAVSAVGGGLSMLGGFLTKNKPAQGRAVFVIGLIIAGVGGIVMLAMGVSLSSNPLRKNIGPETYVYNADRPAGSKKGGTLPANQELHKIWSLAVFEKCCFNKGYDAQALFAPCGTACPSDASGKLLDSRIDIIIDLIDPTDLCTCVKDQAAYTAMLARVDENTCTMLNKARIFFKDDLIIPTTNIKIGVVKSQLFPNTPVIKVPVVGWHLAPELDTSGKTQTGYGFGCGLGYPKGLMWIQEIYYDQNITPLGGQYAGIGGATIGAAGFVVFIFLFLAVSDDDAQSNVDGSMAAKWQNDNVATGIISPYQQQQQPQIQAPRMNMPPPQQPQMAYNGNNGGGLMAQNPTYRGPPASNMQVPGVVIAGNTAAGGGGGGGSNNDLSAQLRAFYRQYDPKKTEADVATISAWGRQNGLQALNAKLRSKYNADLSGPADHGPPI